MAAVCPAIDEPSVTMHSFFWGEDWEPYNDAQLLLECSIGEPGISVYIVSKVVSKVQFGQSRSIYHFLRSLRKMYVWSLRKTEMMDWEMDIRGETYEKTSSLSQSLRVITSVNAKWVENCAAANHYIYTPQAWGNPHRKGCYIGFGLT